MQARAVVESVARHIVETGEIKRSSDVHIWIHKHVEGRSDNLLCVAASESTALIVKTVMINWELEDEV